ncbi:universal stress protein [Actinokineospora sp. PR83]|uniref:universal stress protein n=1 Tax=Actinokineospora sp. PR83 TaxID=2884908 RepID=UPI0027DF5311|nr:universal stress protein [Actinokineospora sp. PR83]MCG8915561.1 universal stress protein [Actinokineospora sp. PR83]
MNAEHDAGHAEPAPPAVVAAVDGSPAALAAATWAAAEADLRRVPLRLVHACVPPHFFRPAPTRLHRACLSALAEQGERALVEAAAAVTAAHPDLEVTREIRTGSAPVVVIEAAGTALMVVTGARGLGGFPGLLVGSVSAAVAAHSPCPVVVVRGEPRRGGPVVVGVDGSAAGDTALGLAFAEAELRGAPLVAVRAFGDNGFTTLGPPPLLPADWSGLATDELRLLRQWLDRHAPRHPGVDARAVVAQAHPRDALLRQAEHAQLVFVGTRGIHLLPGSGLGATSSALLHRAPCPVAVVPVAPTRPADHKSRDTSDLGPR